MYEQSIVAIFNGHKFLRHPVIWHWAYKKRHKIETVTIEYWQGLTHSLLSSVISRDLEKLSLAIPPLVGAVSTSLGWEGNFRSGLVSHWPCVTDNTYGLNGLCKRDEHHAYAPSEYGSSWPLPLSNLAKFSMTPCRASSVRELSFF